MILEIDFIINVNKSDINVVLSNEHSEYKWVTKDSELLDEYIKDKLSNVDWYFILKEDWVFFFMFNCVKCVLEYCKVCDGVIY